MPSPAPPLLGPDDLAALRRLPGLQFGGRARMVAGDVGRHRTPRPGRSPEFLEHRAYRPGDPPDQIDWKAFGRTDRLTVRTAPRPATRTVMLVVDASASMGFTGLDRRRDARSVYIYAARLAALAAALTLQHGDRVGLALAGEGVPAAIPPGASATHLQRITRTLADHPPRGRADLAAVLHHVYRRATRGASLLLLSDLHEPPDAVRRELAAGAAAGCPATVVHLTHPDEARPPRSADTMVEELETGRRRRLNLRRLGPGYAAVQREAQERWRSALASQGHRYLPVTTDMPAWDTLRRLTRAEG
jgi:uncharacterized protein (DUF58 family)